MGWISNDYKHEGWVASVAPDGRLSSTSTREGMLFLGITGDYPSGGDFAPDQDLIPDDKIMNWRGACECGWRGELWQRVLTPAEADFEARREYLAPGEAAFVSSLVEDAVHEEWLAHIAPSEAILGVEAAAREHRQAGHRLDKTVAAAKAAGASWTDIGRAAGISRQAAHERWADK
ncbi:MULTISPECIES: hypothetical protein [Paenarthrobacter]|uniref:hypothetical protein n=1 Tax=Paenarthrobacter TaxID=1742992 RepID=UPI001556239C|nr:MULTISPECIES: hypothetical protein [Paenarthrobacter]MDR6639599.1 hypothetical protein [Paenarthrobacter nitroguajacolicus]NQD89067.1 hypothetical protein [Paenarthrobacter sp. CM16]